MSLIDRTTLQLLTAKPQPNKKQSAVAVFILISSPANGNGQSKNAIEDLIKSAEKGSADSQVALATAYYNGSFVYRLCDKSMRLVDTAVFVFQAAVLR
jgi:TPR repeat protein